MYLIKSTFICKLYTVYMYPHIAWKQNVIWIYKLHQLFKCTNKIFGSTFKWIFFFFFHIKGDVRTCLPEKIKSYFDPQGNARGKYDFRGWTNFHVTYKYKLLFYDYSLLMSNQSAWVPKTCSTRTRYFYCNTYQTKQPMETWLI